MKSKKNAFGIARKKLQATLYHDRKSRLQTAYIFQRSKEELKAVVNAHFKDPKKTALWFKSHNAMYGNLTPNWIIRAGHIKKLLRFTRGMYENTLTSAEQKELFKCSTSGLIKPDKLEIGRIMRKYQDPYNFPTVIQWDIWNVILIMLKYV